MGTSPVGCFVICIACTVSVSMVIFTANSNVSAISKAFNFIEIGDDEKEWFALANGKPSRNGMNATDIESVKYYSDGKVLNATLWFSSLDELSKSKYNIYTIVYGMLIDSDLNENTGFEGIDHQLEVRWSNISKTWTENLNEISISGLTNPISLPINHSESYVKNGHVVKLSLNLSQISYPEKYRVFFYAYNSNRDRYAPWTVDPVRWVYIPPPEFRLVTDDTVINTTQHDKEILEIKVETDTGLKPNVTFIQEHPYKHLKTEFQPEILNMSDDDNTELTITTDSPEVRKTIIPIKARISFPTLYFDSFLLSQNENASRYAIDSQNSTAEPFNLQLIISSDRPIWTPLSDFWNQLGGFLNFIYTPIAAIVTALVGWYVGRNPDKVQRLIPRRKTKNGKEGNFDHTKPDG